MKKLFYMFAVLILSFNISNAQESQDIRKNIESGMTPLMSKMINMLIIKAKTLDLTEEQKKELDVIQ